MTPQEIITMARMVNMRLVMDDFESGALKEVGRIYRRAVDEILTTMKRVKPGTMTEVRMVAMAEELQTVIDNLAGVTSVPVADATVHTGVYSYAAMNDIVSWDGKVVGFNPVGMTAAQIRQLITDQPLGGKKLREWVGSHFLTELGDLQNEIRLGYLKGESYSKIVSRIDNMLTGNQAKQHIESIVKTYIQGINVKAQIDVYDANPEIVKRVEWSSIMEGGNTKTGRGTCPRCAALDGLTWPVKDKTRPPCPLHIRCRCILSPVTITWRDMGFDIDEMEREYKPWVIRAGKQREIIDYGFTDQNYAQWWATRDKNFQNKAIGPRRADMIRDDVIEFGDIVDQRTGRLLRLDELPGVPGFGVKWSTIPDKMVKFESEIIANGFESGMSINKTGRIIEMPVGTAHSVGWNKIRDIEGGILTHNHPGGGSFSDQDILNVFTPFRLREIRAVGVTNNHGYVAYRAQRIGTPPAPNIINRTYEESIEVARNETDKLLSDGIIDVDEANDRLYHRTWEVFETKNKSWFQYKREKIK